MKQFFRFIIGIALLPFCYAITQAYITAFRTIPHKPAEIFSSEEIGFWLGMVLFLILWFTLPQPLRLYIWGHELTHALWGLLFRARVSKVKVNATSGYVKLSKSNLLITLAPYFFPFYTIIVILIALITRIFVSPLPFTPAWMFALGFTWCFHVCFTIKSLTVRQPDILEYGRIFSWGFIWIVNILGIFLWTIITTDLSAKHSLSEICSATVSVYSFVGSNICSFILYVFNSVKNLFV